MKRKEFPDYGRESEEAKIQQKAYEDEEFCKDIKGLMGQRRYMECRIAICNAMAENPDAAYPHNLMGVLLEKEGKHPEAMRHFRAAWALEPAYLPARRNMDVFQKGGIVPGCCAAYCKADCTSGSRNNPFQVFFNKSSAISSTVFPFNG